MTKKIIGGVTIELIKGDIVRQGDLTVIVNAANAGLLAGAGVAGAVHHAAGPDLAEECKTLAPISPGQAVMTSGYKLPNKHIIHCLGPVYGVDEPAAVILADCYKNALDLAERQKVDSIGFPALSTGVFGYPVEDATEIALKTVMGILPDLRHIKRIRFVLFTAEVLNVYEAMLALLVSEAG